jgi:hypothetical protein
VGRRGRRQVVRQRRARGLDLEAVGRRDLRQACRQFLVIGLERDVAPGAKLDPRAARGDRPFAAAHDEPVGAGQIAGDHRPFEDRLGNALPLGADCDEIDRLQHQQDEPHDEGDLADQAARKQAAGKSHQGVAGAAGSIRLTAGSPRRPACSRRPTPS